MTILDEIIADKKIEVEQAKAKLPLHLIETMAQSAPAPRDFLGNMIPMSDSRVKIIAECKKKSPSKGIIVKGEYNPAAIAIQYQQGGAAAISVLTDHKYFGGCLEDLKTVRDTVNLPILRKDFIIDPYQIFEARAAGADTFLLLANVLDKVTLQYFIEIGRELGMEPLVETHTFEEVDLVLETDAKIVGINNRNLKTFDTDLQNSIDLINKIKSSPGRLAICESGIKTNADIETMLKHGFSGFLIGETLVKSKNPVQTLLELRNVQP